MNHHINSKNIQPGDIFVCLPGGEAYIEDAKSRGAVEITPMTRTEWGRWNDLHFNHPSESLIVIGITGTNGKTTTTHILTQALNALGHKAIVQGTLSGALTTPEAHVTHQAMAEHLQGGGTHFVMEVSSHAIAQDRIAGISFAARGLTNITQDHLDYHKTFEAYKSVKMSFINSPLGWRRADPSHIRILPDDYQNVTLPFVNPLVGEFNHQNMQLAVAILRHLGYSDLQIAEAMCSVQPPPGRFETIPEAKTFTVIVDYAHTPDGLEKVGKEAQVLARKSGGKVWIVFGCGGDRDRTKRPVMAQVASQLADIVVVTQDNPRTEDPHQIMQDIQAGLAEAIPTHIIPDRREAIHWTIAQAQANDVVLIAGKGHETYQIIGETKHHFDDREEARNALKTRRL